VSRTSVKSYSKSPKLTGIATLVFLVLPFMKRKATAEDLLAATLRKSQETDALRTDVRAGMLAALEATKQADASLGKVEDADPHPVVTNPDQPGSVALRTEEQRHPRTETGQRAIALDNSYHHHHPEREVMTILMLPA
jgi:hypothetical protein